MPQETVTADSVTINVNAVLYYKITDPQKAIIEVRNYEQATYQAAQTTVRNVIGQHNLDDVLKEREKINNNIVKILDEMTDPWGLKVDFVEMKDVEIPANMQRAMAKEAEATREKRARIIKADAENQAALKLSNAAKEIAENPMALELRRLQMISEVGQEQNTTTIVLMPSEFVSMAEAFAKKIEKQTM